MYAVSKKANESHLRKCEMDVWAEAPMDKTDFLGYCSSNASVQHSYCFVYPYFFSENKRKIKTSKMIKKINSGKIKEH